MTYGNEQVRHLSLILGPSFTVLVPAALDIAQGAVADHSGKEDRVEPREGALEASDQAPVEGEVQIACVVDLAGLAICTGRQPSFLSDYQSTYTTHPQESSSHREP